MEDNISIFDKIMAAITFAEENEHEIAMDFLEEETTISGVLESIPTT